MKDNILTPETLADLARSGLTKRDAEKMGIRSLTADEMWKLYRVRARGYGILYGGGFARVKLLEPYQGRRDKKPRKYAQQFGTKPEIYYPPLFDKSKWEEIRRDVRQPLVITEGEKKAAAAVKAGIACIGLGGVWNFRWHGEALAQLDDMDFRGRIVEIAYDSDIVSKRDVQLAEQALAAELERRGAVVRRIRLPALDLNGSKTGLDDFLVANGLSKKPSVARTAFDALPREEIRFDLTPDRYSDMNNAATFARLHCERLRYVNKWNSWMSYDPATGIWTLDDAEAMKCAKATVTAMLAEAEKIKDTALREAMKGKASKCASIAKLNAMIDLAASEDGMAISHNDLDADTMLLSVGDGNVIELQTGAVRKAHPEDYCTKRIGTVYDPAAKCPRWLSFIEEITQRKRDEASYLQRVAGYCLTGLTIEQCLFLLYGLGKNGKSTFLSVLLALLGDYGTQASPETFMSKRGGGDNIRNDLARLHQVRLIATSEVEEGQKLAEALIKQFTGGDKIVARFMWKELFEFVPAGKILLVTNHKPIVRGGDFAMWRRIFLVPFLARFEGRKADKKLIDKLKAELPGILNWALEGCAEWQKTGLRPPASVLLATQDYQREMDFVGQWIDESCETGGDYKERVTELYASYKSYAEDSGRNFTLDRNELIRRLAERGFIKKDSTTDRTTGRKGAFLVGLRLVRGGTKISR